MATAEAATESNSVGKEMSKVLRYSREEMLEIEKGCINITLDEATFEDHPILSIKALRPNAHDTDFDYEEWCKQARNHRANRNNNNRPQGIITNLH